MAKFFITETIYSEKHKTVRLGSTGAGNQYGHEEIGKAVKLSGDSAYVLCAIGDAIEAVVSSSNYPNQGTVDGFSIGGICADGYKSVTFEGSQAAGTGAIAVGDYVVCGTPVAKGTNQGGLTPMKVRKATDQAAAAAAAYKARVVSLGSVGTGAVGTVGTIEFL